MSRRRRRSFCPIVDILDDRCLLSVLSPSQVTKAYGLDAITFNANGQSIKGDGSGQTIAIVGAYHDPYLAGDLHWFDQTYGLIDPSLTVVTQPGSGADDGWASEETLDVEWAHAIAPGANILVVEAGSNSLQDLLTAVDTARSYPGVSTVSMSWGGAEFWGQVSFDGYFTTPAGHQGVTFVAASGDEGPSRVDWPASSADVVAVGGTTLRVDPVGNYLGESDWSGSSGGYSRYVTEPAYQGSLQLTGRRSTPDVAFDADPTTGVAVYTTSPSTGQGSWYQVGGTSLGATAWAAIIAIADQGRAAAGLGSLDGATQALPALYSLPSGDFHKPGGVTSTGLGTPNGAGLVNGLAAYGISPSHATTGASGSSATSGRHSVQVVQTSPRKPVRSHFPVFGGHDYGRAGLRGGSFEGVFDRSRSDLAFGRTGGVFS